MRTLLTGTMLAMLLLGALALAYEGWFGLGGVEIGFHGMLALLLGTALSLGLGIGLMALAFYSSRTGRDDITDWQPKRPTGELEGADADPDR